MGCDYCERPVGASHAVTCPLKGYVTERTAPPLATAENRVAGLEAAPEPEEPLTLPAFRDQFDRIINDALAERRRMPWLFGKPATELSKRELLALAILQANPTNSYVSKEDP